MKPKQEPFKYERHKPILLNPHDCMIVEIFSRTDDLLNLFTCDWRYDRYNYSKEAAKEFIRHLKGHECDSFLEALGNECLKEYHKRRSEKHQWCIDQKSVEKTQENTNRKKTRKGNK